MGSFFGDLWDDITDIPPHIIERLLSPILAAPGARIGMTIVGETILVGTPNIIIQATAVVQAGVGHIPLLPQTRTMSSRERWLARMVYGNTLPFDKIYLTNVRGKDGRWFVVPNVVGEILVNIGESFEDPIHYTNGGYPEFGQVLIHELGHAWQVDHIGDISYVIEAVPPVITGPDYEPGDGSKSWNEYSIEEQAAIVDHWYAGVSVPEPCSRGNNYYNHVRDTVNAGNEPPVVQTLNVRDVAKSKFDQEGGFSVSSRFPRHNSGSLRRRLIGL